MKKYAIFALVVAFASSAISTNVAAHDTNMTTSWYGPGLQGNLMANGDVFDMNDPTVAAHKTLPFGTRIELRNPETDSSIVVTVQDRGPFIKGRQLDISRAAAKRLGFIGTGVTELEATILD